MSTKWILVSLLAGVVLAVCPCWAKASGGSALADTSPAVSSIALTVEGMTCASCAVAVRIALRRLNGVRDARVSVEEKRAVVSYEPTKVTPQQIVDAVNSLGYHARLAPKGS
jgi:Cu+-exporting ATPase